MSILSDKEIALECEYYDTPSGFKSRVELTGRGIAFPNKKQMIEPFIPYQVRSEVTGKDTTRKVISYGLSSYGYDVRLGKEFKIFRPTTVDGYGLYNVPVDPLNPVEGDYVDIEVTADGSITIPPGGFLLGHTYEQIAVPDDVLIICLGKSTYARLGLVVNVTPLEPGWKGQVVIEISNTSTRPVKVYSGMGIAQFVFFRGNPCTTTYADRHGKYQGQQGVTVAKP